MVGGVIRPLLAEAAYRLRRTLRARRGGYVALALLVGVLGGVALASVAGARRTQSAFPAYLASTNPADLGAFTAFDGLTPTGYSPKVDSEIARLPYVSHEAEVIGFDPTLQVLSPTTSHAAPGQSPPAVEGSPNGEYVTQDRLTVVRGRMTDPARPDEIVMSAGAATESGLRIGSALRVGFFTDAQEASPSFSDYPADTPHLTTTLRLVGIVKASSQIVQDDDAALGNQLAVITPALTRQLMTCCAGYAYVMLKLQGGTRHLATVRGALKKLVPASLRQVGGTQTPAPLIAKTERVIRPEAIAFGVFGLIAGLAALVICALAVGRTVRRSADDASVLRALGASPGMVTVDRVAGALTAVVAGAALAVGVAIALSPLAPIGPVRPVYPHRGIAADWTVLGAGFVVLVGVLAATALFIAHRTAPHRSRPGTEEAQRPSALARAAATGGLSPATVTGIRAAVGADARRGAPVRSALLGAVGAVVLVVASVTFGSSLQSLVSHPALYGWNWDYALLSAFSGQEDLPAPLTASLFDRDPEVASWSGVYFAHLALDGQSVAVLATRPALPSALRSSLAMGSRRRPRWCSDRPPSPPCTSTSGTPSSPKPGHRQPRCGSWGRRPCRPWAGAVAPPPRCRWRAVRSCRNRSSLPRPSTPRAVPSRGRWRYSSGCGPA